MKSVLAILSFLWVFVFPNSSCQAAVQTVVIPEILQPLPYDSTTSVSRNDLKNYRTFNTFLWGTRVNYIQGKDGFLGCSGTFMWHNIGYILESHLGFSAGMDFRLTKSMVYAPKITFEYRYLIGIARVGYCFYSDFKSDFDHRISGEIGLSLLSFVDVTYLHSFGSEKNPFQLGRDYLNITATLPLNI